jgi:hypothetical protein
VHGIDMARPLAPAAKEALHDAWMEHQVLFFREQAITVDQHKAFARNFGELHVHPVLQQMADQGHPEIVVLESDARRPVVADRWHSDVTFEREPPLGSILRAVEVPAAGGDTMWASMTAAYDALSAPMQGALEGLRARTTAPFPQGGDRSQSEVLAQNEVVIHPVIRTHRNRPQVDLRQLDVHQEHRGHEAAREPGAARLPVRARDRARVQLPLPLAPALDRDVGQPLHPAPRGDGQPFSLPADGAGDPDRGPTLLGRACSASCTSPAGDELIYVTS